MKRTEWFKRSFPIIDDNGVLPDIIERLRGTPIRLEAMLSPLDNTMLTAKAEGKWSMKEQAGHLADMEPLWLGRLDDLAHGIPELREADLTNQRTHTANHNATNLSELLQLFKVQRQQLVNRLLTLQDTQLLHVALHPRLKTPMRIIDLAYFVAEHDDHHLTSIREIMK
ncbi:DinB family protein [Chitinophaga polysaccharea]|uniref:DinB family protein n=1 Tax=Chitinophaga TaxID=79328 RepID=UPI00145546B6|nr:MULTISPECIES: DinB family protein [Chitinophaga]NLR59144.1 DinB family protein [Chitinophaga polysaccharea]NLU92085.1 DinB family protein [Chitinophaga sp. Ak27]